MKEKEEEMSQVKILTRQSFKIPHYNLHKTLQFAHTYKYFKKLQPLVQNT